MASGGENATHPTSKYCRDFLLAVLTICHQIVITPDVAEEWGRHQSNFARKWRVSMVAKKKLHIIRIEQSKELRDKIENAAKTENQKKAMLKDAHLIEAALAADKIVFSLDEIVRDLFSEATGNIRELRDILWANPDKEEDQCIIWLEGGARVEKKRLLGSVAKL